MSPKQQAARRKIFKLFKIGVQEYRDFDFQVLREWSSMAARNGEVQMFFLTPTRNMLLRFIK